MGQAAGVAKADEASKTAASNINEILFMLFPPKLERCAVRLLNYRRLLTANLSVTPDLGFFKDGLSEIGPSQFVI